MNLLLESLVTTLLLYHDNLHQKPADPLTYYKQHQPQLSLQVVRSRCRSNSLSVSSSSDSDSSIKSMVSSGAAISQCHPAPNDSITYDDNDTVFGAILRGDLRAVTLAATSHLLSIEDIKPRAPLHALVIPKAFVGSVFDVEDSNDDMEWMQDIHDMALELIQTHQPEAYQTGDYRLCFHIPLFNSVNHLHLHVLAPVSKMGFFYKHIKYNPRTRWCIGMEEVMRRLKQGESAVPYQRPLFCKPQKEQVKKLVEKESSEDPAA